MSCSRFGLQLGMGSFIPFCLSTLHHKTPREYTILLASARPCLSPTGLRPPRPNLSCSRRAQHVRRPCQDGGRDQGALIGDKVAAQDLAGFLPVSPASLGPRPRSPGPGLCCSVPGRQPAACPFSPSPNSCTDAPDWAELSTAVLTKSCSDHLSSPQTCGHESKFSWIFSQMSRPVTFPWA